MVTVILAKPLTMLPPKPAFRKTYCYFGFLTLVFIILIVSCRKIDPLVERKSLPSKDSRFFTTHLPKDSIVGSVLNFVKRENEKHQFVDNLNKKNGLSILG